jgi:hypothetical protein
MSNLLSCLPGTMNLRWSEAALHPYLVTDLTPNDCDSYNLYDAMRSSISAAESCQGIMPGQDKHCHGLLQHV